MSGVTVIGTYELHGLLGRGGMGEVYRAFDRDSGRFVALKLLPTSLASDQGYSERFRRESFLAARLNDPHVIPIHRFGEVDGRLFIDMRLVNGLDLDKVIERTGPLPAPRAARIVSQAAEALDAAHAENLVHRDVKPSNLLVTPQEFVYLVDFGIAYAVGLLTEAKGLTATGAAIGTLDYMAPERFLGHTDIDGRVDVYSLACVLFESLTAQRPFPVDGLPALMHAHATAPPPRVTAFRPDLPDSVDAVVARGMAKDPAARYASAGELAADAAQALHHATPHRTGTTRVTMSRAMAGPSAPDHTARTSVFVSSPTVSHHPEGIVAPVGTAPVHRRHRPVAWVVAGASLVVTAALTGVLLGPGGLDVLDLSGARSAATEASISSLPAPTTTAAAETTPTTMESATTDATTAGTTEADTTTIASGSIPTGEAEDALLTYFLTAGAGDHEAAWDLLSPGYQAEYGSFTDFVDFWETVETVGPSELDVTVLDRGPDSLVFVADVFFSLQSDVRSDETITVTFVRAESGTLLIDDYSARAR